MKVIFICGCIEPGKDGVGDYTRRLAVELAQNGVHVILMAINDRFISEEKEENVQKSKVGVINEIRIPKESNLENKKNTIKKWVNRINPEWISLQFVPYSFNDKGLPFDLARFLKKTVGAYKWHIMFHELWLGTNKEATFKETLTGFLQKMIIKKLLNELNPEVIHTQTFFYKQLLQNLGYKATILPLVSNIPNRTTQEEDIDKRESNINWLKTKPYFVIFGGIHHGAPVKQFAEDLLMYYKDKRLVPGLVAIGRNGDGLKEWESVWKAYGLEFLKMGEQPTSSISNTLKNAYAGICTTPFVLVDKSGSVAAMKNHNLPVLCVSRKWTPKTKVGEVSQPGVFEYERNGLEDYLNNLDHVNPISFNISEMTSLFIKALKK